MSDQTPTPETDAFALSEARTDHGWRTLARRLERERDEVTKIAATANTEAVRYMKERDLARKSFAAIDSLNASYVAAWKEVTQALGQPEAGDKTCDVDRVLKAIKERDEAQAEVARLREDVLRWFAYIDPFELVDDDRKHFERWREEQALATVGGETTKEEAK
jgi:hypothetical protein